MLAVTVVLQALQGLSDYEAVQALRCDLRWKAACGLGLLDTGFDPSLLTYFRRRLARSADPGRLFFRVGLAPPVERAIAWLVAHGNRRVPYRGVTKNNTWLHNRAAALNLRRLVNLGLTRTSDGNWALA